MGEIVMAVKATHVPSMLISEQPGPAHGCRQAAPEDQQYGDHIGQETEP
mgnify:CR=1 FL=1